MNRSQQKIKKLHFYCELTIFCHYQKNNGQIILLEYYGIAVKPKVTENVFLRRETH